jgi:hypothetical protein
MRYRAIRGRRHRSSSEATSPDETSAGGHGEETSTCRVDGREHRMVDCRRVCGWRAKHAVSLGHGINLRLAWVRAGAEVDASPRLAFTLYVIMAKSITVKRKKAGRPATGTEPLYGVRISDELMGQIQKWGRENSATRSEAIRRLVELGLKAKGK